MKRLPVFVLAAAVLAGCSASRKAAIDTNLTLQQIIGKVNERNGKIRTMSAGGSVTVESPSFSASGSFVLNLKKPDSMKIEVRGPLGIKFVTIAISKDNFIFYSWMENRAVTAKPDSGAELSLLGIRLGVDEIFNTFTGNFEVDPGQSGRSHFTAGDGFYLLHICTDDGVREYRVTGEIFTVSDYRFINRDGEVAVKAELSRYEETDGCIVPRFLRVIFPKEQKSISVAYDEIEINKDADCRFSLPKNAGVMTR